MKPQIFFAFIASVSILGCSSTTRVVATTVIPFLGCTAGVVVSGALPFIGACVAGSAAIGTAVYLIEDSRLQYSKNSEDIRNNISYLNQQLNNLRRENEKLRDNIESTRGYSSSQAKLRDVLTAEIQGIKKSINKVEQFVYYADRNESNYELSTAMAYKDELKTRLAMINRLSY